MIDMGRFIAGPMCAAMLGDLGADVIRVERVEGGDDRFQYLTGPAGDNGACFLQWNRNKRSLTLDPMADGAREILHRLVKTADVVVANLPQEGLEQLGIDYSSLTAVRPDVILVHPSAFGAQGPYADRVGLDGIGQAMSGINHLSGFGDRPTKSFASWVDCSTAMLSAFGALAALMHRRQTGQGQLVRTDLLRSALNVSSFILTEQALTGRDRVASGNRAQSSCPADIVRTRDGWIMLQCVGQPLYKRWARLMGEDRWLTDARFQTDESRAEHGEILSERTARWAAGRTTDEALTELADCANSRGARAFAPTGTRGPARARGWLPAGRRVPRPAAAGDAGHARRWPERDACVDPEATANDRRAHGRNTPGTRLLAGRDRRIPSAQTRLR